MTDFPCGQRSLVETHVKQRGDEPTRRACRTALSGYVRRGTRPAEDCRPGLLTLARTSAQGSQRKRDSSGRGAAGTATSCAIAYHLAPSRGTPQATPASGTSRVFPPKSSRAVRGSEQLVAPSPMDERLICVRPCRAGEPVLREQALVDLRKSGFRSSCADLYFPCTLELVASLKDWTLHMVWRRPRRPPRSLD